MIIAYYPGAGGNRFYQRLLNKDWAQPGISYDASTKQLFSHRYLLGDQLPAAAEYTLTHCMNSQRIQEVFAGEPMIFIKSNLQLSLQREWALHGHRRFQDNNVKPSVSRLEHYAAIKDDSWPVIDHEQQFDQLPQYIQEEIEKDYIKVTGLAVGITGALAKVTQSVLDKVNSAYETLKWHQDYYQQYPVDFSAAAQVIDIDTDDSDFCEVMRTELARHRSEIFEEVWNAINDH
jgi:hypothetical protein